MKTLDILIGTNGNFSAIQPLLNSLHEQTWQDFRIVVLLYPEISSEESELFLYHVKREYSSKFSERIQIFSHLNSDFESGNGHGYDRHFLVEHATAQWVYLIDHDNVFKHDFLEKTISWYETIQKDISHPFLVAPTVMRGKTGEIQSQGIVGFLHAFPKYEYRHMQPEEDRQEVIMMGANTLYGPRDIFQQIQFDPLFRSSYEDIDFTRRLTLGGNSLIVLNHVATYHMEGERPKLSRYLLASPESAYRRSMNRIIFVKKTATMWQKICYFGVGVWIQTGGFLFVILLWGKGDQLRLRKSVLQGTLDGIAWKK